MSTMQVAILIPTMNRPEFIKRIVTYYNSLNSPHPIYIGDASNSEVATRITIFLKNIRNVNVKYFHWEGLGVNQTIIKLAEAAQNSSGYCAVHGDDDYFIPLSLTRCAEFLSQNPDYRTVQGRSALFTLDRPGPFGNLKSLVQYWGINELEQLESIDRLMAFEQNYYVLQFATHRIDEFLNASQDYLNIVDDSIGELLHCFTFAILGKSKFLNFLYLIRNSHEDIDHAKFLDWCALDYWSSDCKKIVNSLTEALHDTSEISMKEAAHIVSDILKRRFVQKILKDYRIQKRGYLIKLKQMMPDYIKNLIRRIKCSPKYDTDMRLLISDKSLFHSDFLPVYNSFSLDNSENYKR